MLQMVYHYKLMMSSYARQILLLSLCSCLLACHKGQREHAENFAWLYRALDTASFENMKALHIRLDSAFSHDNPDDFNKAKYYRLKGWYNFRIKNFEKALAYDDTAIMLSRRRLKEDAFSEQYTVTLAYKGDIYAELRRYDEALAAYAQAKLVYNKTVNDSCDIAVYNSRIANILYFLGRFLQAADYYKQSYEIRQTCTAGALYQFMEVQMNMDNTGLAYFGAGMLDSAEYFYTKASAYIDSNKHRFPAKAAYIKLAQGVIEGNLGQVREKQGRYGEAVALLQSSIEHTRAEDPYYSVTPQLTLAKIFLKTGDIKSAENAVNDLQHSKEYLGLGSNKVQYFEILRDFYGKRGDLAAAKEYGNAYNTAKDSLDNFTRKTMYHDFGQDFAMREQKLFNELLVKENEVKSFQLTVAILASIMAVGIIIFILYNLRKSARHVKKLEELNYEIATQKDDLFKMFVSLEQSHNENAMITRMVAHDLKNPISGIRSLANMILKKKEYSADTEESLELISNASTNSISLINDLIKDKKGLTELHKEMVDMGKLLQYCVTLLQTKADEKSQQISLHAATVVIPANRQKIWRVISNLINNAVKFSPQNSLIEVKLEQEKEILVLSVRDNGIGIPNELKDKIFAADADVSRSGTSGEESHGLGLLISRMIVEEHKGKIWFESEEGSGSIFYVALPIAN